MPQDLYNNCVIKLNMELDEIVDRIIEESGKQLITVRPKIMYKIGTEIETVISGYSCDSCDYCRICDNCPVCEDCARNRYYCNSCDIDIKQRIIEIAEENGWITPDEAEKLKENLDSDEICDLCQRFDIWNIVHCEHCGRCEDCSYVRNPAYCPYQDEYTIDDINIDRIEQYLDNYYHDESCGMEFVTKPFSSLKDYWKAVKEIVKVVGKENIDISERCGGHINISWENGNKSWLDYDTIIASNILFFSDLLSYMFCSSETHWRYTYKEFPGTPDNYKKDFIDKYCCVHLKDYAIEVRIPDSPKDVDNHVLFTATLLAIAMKTYEIPFDKETFSKTKEIYKKINRYGDTINKEDYAYLRDKFKLLKRFIEKPLKALSHDLGVDLMKALEYRFNNPKYEEIEEKDFDLKQFAIKTRVKANAGVNVIPSTQLTLTAFA